MSPFSVDVRRWKRQVLGMRRVFFLILVQLAWTMPFANDERYIHDIVGLVKEDVRFYEQLENEPLLVSIE